MKTLLVIFALSMVGFAADPPKELTTEQQLALTRVEAKFATAQATEAKAQQAEKDSQEEFKKLQAEYCGTSTLSQKQDGSWYCTPVATK